MKKFFVGSFLIISTVMLILIGIDGLWYLWNYISPHLPGEVKAILMVGLTVGGFLSFMLGDVIGENFLNWRKNR